MVKREIDVSDPEAGEETPGSSMMALKKLKLTKNKLYKPPTSDELIALKETQNLYQSSLFKLQMKELISEVQLSDKRKKNLTSLLHTLNKALTSLPDQAINELSDTSWLPKDVKLPMEWRQTQNKGQACFQKPSSVKVIGSFLLDTSLRSDFNVDISVEIPKACLHQKDYLNFRYHHKRALYCAYLVKHLHKHQLIEDIQYGLANGDQLRPVVILTLTGKANKHVRVKLHPCLPEDALKESRCLPSKSNIRKQWYTGQDEDEDKHDPTPIYNASMLADMNLEKHLHHLYNTSLDFQGFKDGMFLLKVWLHQREMDKGVGAFTGFIMSMVVAYLLSERKLHKLMSGYQVMRSTLLYLASSNWTEKGATMYPEPDKQDAAFMAEFHQYFDVVFIDQSGYLNLCARMTTATYARVKHESQLALSCLDNKAIDAFDVLFMTKVPFLRKFDHCLHIHNLQQLAKSCKHLKCEERLMQSGEDYLQSSLPGLIALLYRALGERVYLLDVRLPGCKQWHVSSPPPTTPSKEDSLTFGLLLNSEFSTSILDKGPPANTPEAADFGAFWGDKSELRRFKDTSICEAVVWPGSSTAEKRVVCQHIVRHVLKLHASIIPSTVSYTGGHLDSILTPHSSAITKSTRKPTAKMSSTTQHENLGISSGEEENVAVIKAYTNLSKCLRKLNGLPLTITSVQGVSATFRYTEVFPLSAITKMKKLSLHGDHQHVQIPDASQRCPDWMPVQKVVCHMEGSGQWPDDLEAIKRIKAAFHIRLSEVIHKQYNLVSLPTSSFVDVMQDGYVFRVEVGHRREIALMKQQFTPQGLLILRDNAKSLALEKETVHLPRLTSMLHGLQQQHNTLSNTVRLAKRWVCAHLLSKHIPEECIELIVAYLYLQPAPYTAPSSPMAGFLRFLNLLSTHDWNNLPLIVNLNNELADADYSEIKEHFSKSRPQLPIMFIATPIEKLSSVWTKGMPTAQILKRLVILARESLHVLQTQLENNSKQLDVKQIFRPPLETYDVIIRLKQKLVPRWRESIDDHTEAIAIVPWAFEEKRETEASVTSMKKLPIVNFDPVECYIKDLEAAYGAMALFFHDRHGGDLVAVVWKPSAFTQQQFKVKHAQGKMPKESHAQGKDPDLILNIEAILDDFQTLGQGLVKAVEVRTHNIEKWM